MNRLLQLLFLISLTLGASRPNAWADKAPSPGKRTVCVCDFRVDPALVTTDKGPLGTIGAATGEAREAAGLWNGPLQRVTKMQNRLGRKESPEELAAKVVTIFTESLVGELLKQGVAATHCAAAGSRRDALFIQGDFLNVDEGNAVREATIGFGTGAPAIEVSGTLTDNTTDPPTMLYQFGGKNHDLKLPGGAVTLNPVVIGVKYHLSKGATGKDVKKLAVQMGQDIAGFLGNKKSD